MRKAFTWAEILIIALIIGTLIAIGVPNYIKTRAISYKKICIANMKSIERAAEEYEKKSGRRPTIQDLVRNGEIPSCPSSGVYSLAPGRVFCSEHGGISINQRQ